MIEGEGDLIEGNEYEQHLRGALSTLHFEFKRQLELERDRKKVN